MLTCGERKNMFAKICLYHLSCEPPLICTCTLRRSPCFVAAEKQRKLAFQSMPPLAACQVRPPTRLRGEGSLCAGNLGFCAVLQSNSGFVGNAQAVVQSFSFARVLAHTRVSVMRRWSETGILQRLQHVGAPKVAGFEWQAFLDRGWQNCTCKVKGFC